MKKLLCLILISTPLLNAMETALPKWLVRVGQEGETAVYDVTEKHHIPGFRKGAPVQHRVITDMPESNLAEWVDAVLGTKPIQTESDRIGGVFTTDFRPLEKVIATIFEEPVTPDAEQLQLLQNLEEIEAARKDLATQLSGIKQKLAAAESARDEALRAAQQSAQTNQQAQAQMETLMRKAAEHQQKANELEKQLAEVGQRAEITIDDLAALRAEAEKAPGENQMVVDKTLLTALQMHPTKDNFDRTLAELAEVQSRLPKEGEKIIREAELAALSKLVQEDGDQLLSLAQIRERLRSRHPQAAQAVHTTREIVHVTSPYWKWAVFTGIPAAVGVTAAVMRNLTTLQQLLGHSK